MSICNTFGIMGVGSRLSDKTADAGCVSGSLRGGEINK